MAERITYVALDVHKETIVVAAGGGLRGEVREYGRIANTSAALDRLLRKLGGDGVNRRRRIADLANFLLRRAATRPTITYRQLVDGFHVNGAAPASTG